MSGVGPRAIFVTGASTGIGRACVAYAVARGAHAYAGVRRSLDADALRAVHGEGVTPVICDVTDEASIERAADAVFAAQKGRRLTGLVNNAGVSVAGPLIHMTTDEFRAQMDVNLIGVHVATRAFAPLLGAEGPRALADGDPGRIVMISSVGGKRAMPFIAAYAASKFAVEGYSEGLRRELMPFGVGVVVVGPGAVKTEIWGKGVAMDTARYQGSVYKPIIERFIGFVRRMEAGGLPAEAIAKVVWRGLTVARPRLRYAVTPPGVQDALMGALPPRMLDGVLATAMGLGRRK